MTTDQILDRILIPRPDGSAGLKQVAEFIAGVLERNGAMVSLHEFAATLYGFQLAWTAALRLALAGMWWRRRGKELPRSLSVPVAALAMLPFAARFWFHTVGPLVRVPSPGAIDNGGSLVAIERSTELLLALVARADARPELVLNLGRNQASTSARE